MFTRKRYCVVFAVAATGFLIHAEFTGYALFDRPNGTNLLCDLDPTCRSLTEGEIELARGVFTDKIDYRRVKVFDRSFFGPLSFSNTMAPNGNIYVTREEDQSPDYSISNKTLRALFMHETTHIWQEHSGRSVIISAAHSLHKHNGQYEHSYDYRNTDIADFGTLEIEQQASLVQDHTYDLSRYDDVTTNNRYPYSVRGEVITLDDALDDICYNLSVQTNSLSTVFDVSLPPGCVDLYTRHPHLAPAAH